MTQYIIKPNDIPNLMDSMIECFSETDRVNAKLLAEKMTEKTGRIFTYQNVGYLYTLLGFVSTPVENRAERYLVKNLELIENIKRECPVVSEKTMEVNKLTSPYNKVVNDTKLWNYFKA